MPGLRFDDKLPLELTMPSTVPPGRSLFASLPRHFVPGYYRAVPPGQKPFAHRGASQLSGYFLVVPPGHIGTATALNAEMSELRGKAGRLTY